jgi:hypothetical protein
MDEFERMLILPKRKIIIALNEINLSKKFENIVFLLIVEESMGSAGGRAGGSGNRKISQIIGFKYGIDGTKKFFETLDQDIINKFEIPYSAVAMDIKLSDGDGYVVQGILDPILIESSEKIAHSYRKE